jgi:hypothetical protein
MDKKLKKKVENQLVSAMAGVLSKIHSAASEHSKKKVKEAGKAVAKKFVKAMEAGKNSVAVKSKAVKKTFKKPAMPKRDSNGKFTKKK